MTLVASLMWGLWLWNQKPDYKVLLSNYSDRDGGAIIAALQTMNVPYQFSDGGSAILVPAPYVHDARLKLAAQGLPKGGNVGFELMENQKLGISQFHEQVNFQRAMEGELARTIDAIGVVQAARVHLAIPKPSVFIREKQKPTASVMLNLYPGRTLERQQVSAIVHLVSSSVPELAATQVTVVDQDGNLLSGQQSIDSNGVLNASQVKFVSDLETSIARRIESILAPLVGTANVRAEASVEVDFTRTEQAAETYKPNKSADEATVRSHESQEQRREQSNTNHATIAGAASNRAESTNPTTSDAINRGEVIQKESTTHYEVDKTIKYTQQAMGGIKRLTVAVLINHKQEVGADGKMLRRPLNEGEKNQVTALVKDAMGFNAERGDSLNIMNSAFAQTPHENVDEPAFWKSFMTFDVAKTSAQYLLSAVLMLYLFFKVLRPLLNKALQPPTSPSAQQNTLVTPSPSVEESSAPQGYQHNLQSAKQKAVQEPKVVATVVKNWVNGHE